MRDFGAAIGLVFAIEGLLLAGFTDTMRSRMAEVARLDPKRLRWFGLGGGGVRRAPRLGGARFGGIGGAWSRFGHDWLPELAFSRVGFGPD